MSKFLSLFFLVVVFQCHAGLESYFRKIEHNGVQSNIKNIDFIYLINLDQRPEKWHRCCELFQPYGIELCRFPAIYGWGLSDRVLSDLGVLFQQGMRHSPSDRSRGIGFGSPRRGPRLLNQDCYGQKYLSEWMSLGAVGCMLSHLSVMQDAYDSGYQVILVLEDDVIIRRDPHLLSEYIEKLDELVGRDGWDLLYTDAGGFYGSQDERDRELYKEYPWFWRPNTDISDYSFMVQHEYVSEFERVGTRGRTHGMVINRGGMKKILDFEKERGLFLPIDIDLGFIPEMRLFSINNSVIGYTDCTSDTHNRNFS